MIHYVCLLIVLAFSQALNYTQKSHIPISDQCLHLTVTEDEKFLKVFTRTSVETYDLDTLKINNSRPLNIVTGTLLRTKETGYYAYWNDSRITHNGKDIPLKNSKTSFIYGIAKGKDGEVAMTDMRHGQLIFYNSTTKTTMYNTAYYLNTPRSIIHDGEGNYYITVNNGIFSTKEKKIIAGRSFQCSPVNKSCYEVHNYTDGSLVNSRFAHPTAILLMDKGVLAVTDYSADKVAIVDIGRNNVRTFLDLPGANCLAMTKDRRTLFVGGNRTIRMYKNNSIEKNLCYGLSKSGIANITVNGRQMEVFCDVTSADGPWIVILRRLDGSVSFDRDWKEYETGFGDKSREFWLGLENIYHLTKNKNTKLKIELEQDPSIFQPSSAFAQYERFWISDEKNLYALEGLESYSGTADDMETLDPNKNYGGPHKGQKFSTRDRDNDASRQYNCAKASGGGWWFRNCFTACLTCDGVGFSSNLIYYPYSQDMGLSAASMMVKVPYELA